MPWAIRKGAGGCGKTRWAVVNADTGAKRGCHATVAKARKQLAALNVNVTEEGTMPDTLERLTFHETRPLAEAATPAEGTGRLLVQLITPGWGTTGYYTPEVLEEAAAEQIFPAGTQMYLDHPTYTESVERPARSVRDLAGVLVEDAVWNGQALVAQARVFDTFRHAIAEMADSIGVSIRGGAEVSDGEAEGRRGRIVERIAEVASVDFVTRAGRGGRIIQVLESATPARVVERAISAGVAEATAENRREQLRQALNDTYATDEKRWVWVRDFDEDTVWFERDGGDQAGTWQQSYTVNDEDTVVSLTGDPVEVRAETRYVPVPAAEAVDTPPPADAEPSGDTPPDDTTPPAEDATTTEEPAGAPDATAPSAEETAMPDTPGAGATAPTNPRQVMEAELAQLRRTAAIHAARNRARDVVTETLADAWLPPLAIRRITADLLEDDRLPLVNDTLDEAALRDRATRARDAAEAEHAESLQAQGLGRPRGLGGTAQAGGEQINLEERLGGAFRELGMSESAADLAAKGR